MARLRRFEKRLQTSRFRLRSAYCGTAGGLLRSQVRPSVALRSCGLRVRACHQCRAVDVRNRVSGKRSGQFVNP